MTRSVLILAALAGCYSPPEPDCGFACGPGDACPADYTCARDHYCHRNGASSTLVCGTPDAAVDAPPAPTVTSTVPADGEMFVAVDVIPSATFSEDVVGVSDATMSLTSSAGAVAGNAYYSVQLARFIPDAQLEQNTTYTVHLAAGIMGTNGAPLAPYQWSFTTNQDTVGPHVQVTMPANAETGVATTSAIRVTFDEPVMNVDATDFLVDASGVPVAGTFASADMRTWTFTPDVALPSAALITVSLYEAITDRYGNQLTRYTFDFTTQ
jgi:hypothetical protein